MFVEMTRDQMLGSHGIMAGTLPRQMGWILSVDPQNRIVVLSRSWAYHMYPTTGPYIHTTCGTELFVISY